MDHCVVYTYGNCLISSYLILHYVFIISFIQSTGSGCFSAHDVSASTHLTSPGSSCSLSSVLFSPLLPTAPSMPYFSLCCLELLFHGRKSFQHSQPFHWIFLSAIVLNWILALPRGSCCSCSLLFPAYLRLPFWLMTPSSLCKISSSFQVRADLKVYALDCSHVQLPRTPLRSHTCGFLL